MQNQHFNGMIAIDSSTFWDAPTGEVAPSRDEVEAASATEAIIVTPTASLGADEEIPRLKGHQVVLQYCFASSAHC